jgi:hypothetical protein
MVSFRTQKFFFREKSLDVHFMAGWVDTLEVSLHLLTVVNNTAVEFTLKSLSKNFMSFTSFQFDGKFCDKLN